MPQIEVPGVGAVDFPDTMSDEQITSAAQKLYEQNAAERAGVAPREAPPPLRGDWEQSPHPHMNNYSNTDRFAIGVARPAAELYQGVKGLFTDVPPEEKRDLERVRDISSGPAGTAGRITGELATLAIPGKGVAKVVTLLPRARAALFAGDTAMNAGMEALKAPSEGESRAGNAAGGAAGALAGGVLTRTLGALGGAVMRGVRRTPAAQEMLDQGVPLTPGMAHDGGWIRSLEEGVEGANIPFVSKAVRNLRGNAVEGWNKNLLASTVPDGAVTSAGRQGFAEAAASFKKAYSEVFDKPVELAGDLGNDWMALSVRAARELPDQTGGAVLKKLDSIYSGLGQDGGKVAGRSIEQADDALRDAGTAAWKRGASDEADFYSEARKALRGALPGDMSARLTQIDSMYRQYSVLRKATTYKAAQERGGVFTPSELTGASVAKDKSAGKTATAAGVAAMQQQADQGRQVLGDVLPSQRAPTLLPRYTPTAIIGAMLGLPTLGTGLAVGRAAASEPMRRALLGGTAPQRFAKQLADSEQTRRTAEMLRQYVRGTTLGAAVDEE